MDAARTHATLGRIEDAARGRGLVTTRGPLTPARRDARLDAVRRSLRDRCARLAELPPRRQTEADLVDLAAEVVVVLAELAAPVAR